jgi:hypothetical protein
VRVNDGVVFAADSASSISRLKPNGESETINVYNSGLKVFNLYKGQPIAAMTCGMGSIGSLSIASLAKHLRHLLTHGDGNWKLNPDNFTIQEVVEKAKRYLFEDQFAVLADPKPTDVFEFWIGGYSSDMSSPYELWKIVIDGAQCGDPIQLCQPGEAGISWGGAHEPINRLIIGYDHTMTSALQQLLTPAQPGAAVNMVAVEQFLRARTEVILHSPLMPVQDAIEFANFLVETTKGFYRYLPGANIVGGDTDIAVVTRYEGFKWVRRKHFYEHHLNRLETDHV